MAHKRPFDDDVADEGSSKHQRQDGPNDEKGLCNDSFSREGTSGTSPDIGESSIGKNELELRQEYENGSCPSISREVVEDVESNVPRSASLSHWATSSTSDEDEPPEELVQFYPGCFSFDHPVKPVVNPDDVYYCLLDYPPRERVPVGPDHQADIPSWGTQVNRTTSDGSGSIEPASSRGNSVRIVDGELGGICILPIPKTQFLPYNGDNIGYGRTECACPDQGSMRCVRQHIVEARDKLRLTLGQEIFMELGFYDMGEVVADKWSEEEEQLFHEVVYSNPVSLGKNFWNVLSAVFPSRTKMEIVSYYFNVFMLRKRAKQNRWGPMNIDSDNDEWQGSSDDGGGEVEDSGIQPPVRHGGPELHQNGFHLHEDKHAPEDDAAKDVVAKVRTMLTKEKKMKDPLMKELRKITGAFAHNPNQDAFQRALCNSALACISALETLVEGHELKKQIAVSDEMLIRKDQTLEAMERHQKGFDKAMEEIKATAKEAKDLCEVKAQEAVKLKSDLKSAEQNSAQEKSLREKAESDKRLAEGEVEQLNKSLKDALDKYKTELDAEQLKFRDLQAEFSKLKESHAKEIADVVEATTQKVKEETMHDYSDCVMSQLADYLPTFHPGFNWPGFRAYLQQKMKEHDELLASLKASGPADEQPGNQPIGAMSGTGHPEVGQ